MNNRKKILLLTLVNPDFLPPVYAVAQVLRDLGFDVHVLTFDSFVPAEFDVGKNITIEPMGRHYDAGLIKRLVLRHKFFKRAKELVSGGPISIITFCPFSFQCGLKIKKNIPLIYITLEMADFKFPQFFRSPLSNYRNFLALKNIHKADLIATPSIQRSAWLAGRCHLGNMPYTVLNTVYLKKEENSYDTFKALIPLELLDKKFVVYTGAVNSDLCTMELVRAFDLVDDPGSALIITGLKDDEYSADIKKFVSNCRSQKRITLFPYLTRNQMIALQSNSHIGACLIRESQNNVKSKMIAPNKVGEYMSRDLYILGIQTDYLRPFEIKGLASLANTPTPRDISKALRRALQTINDNGYKEKIKTFVQEEFCMQQQLEPVIRFINETVSIS
jgi:hypothetical protein